MRIYNGLILGSVLWATTVSGAAIAILDVASKTPPEILLSCGTTQGCANYTKLAKTVVKHHEDLTKQWSFTSWPGALSWSQCYDTCNSVPDCLSFQYNYVNDNEHEPSNWACTLYFKHVSEYAEDPEVCEKNPDLPSLNTFWEKGCPMTLTANLSGTITPNPSRDHVNGTCDSRRQPMDVPTLVRDQLGTGFNVNQSECAAFCHDTPNCKSYWWEGQPSTSQQGPYEGSAANWPWNSPDDYYGNCGFSPAACLLFSQPLSSYLSADVGSLVSGFYDLKCGTPGYKVKHSNGTNPFVHGPEPSDCYPNNNDTNYGGDLYG